MQPRSFAIAILAASAAFACSGSGPGEAPAPVWTPVGTWSFSTIAQGQPVGGTISISGMDGAYMGMIEPDPMSGVPPLPISSATMDGNEMTVTADAGGVPLSMMLIFDGDAFTGSWSMAGDGGEVSGARVN